MRKVLIVDDEVVLRMLIEDTLEVLDNTQIDTAENGLQALNKLSSNQYHLVILDYMMPGMTGLELLGKLDAETKQSTAILMLTAKAQDRDRLLAIEAGARYFVSKPFSPLELLQIVEEILSDEQEC